MQLFGLVLWFGATYGQFLTFKLEISTNTQHSVVIAGLGALVSAVVIALTVRAPSVIPAARTIRFWYIASALLTTILVTLVMLYQQLGYTWTCPAMQGTHLVMGSVPTPELIQFLRSGGKECAAYAQFAGLSESMYEPSSVWPRYQLLGGVYILSWALLAALMISVTNCFQVKQTLS